MENKRATITLGVSSKTAGGAGSGVVSRRLLNETPTVFVANYAKFY